MNTFVRAFLVVAGICVLSANAALIKIGSHQQHISEVSPSSENEFGHADVIFGGLRDHSSSVPSDIKITWEAPPDNVNYGRGSNLLKILHRHGAGMFAHLLNQTGAVNDLQAASGPFTVFAPLDHAFERVSQEIKDYFSKHPDRLRKLLSFHVLKKQRSSVDDLEDEKEKTFTTMYDDRKMRVKYYERHDSLIAGSGLVVKTKSDIAFDNGLVHALHDVILSIPRNTSGAIIQKCPNFATLQKAILAAGVESALVQAGPLTVFAPSEAAWAQLPPDVERKIFNNRTALKLVVLYHLVHGTWFKEGLETGQMLETLSGRQVQVHRSADTGILRINKVGVEFADVAATNGIIHVMKGVLLPNELQYLLPPDYVTGLGSAETAEVVAN